MSVYLSSHCVCFIVLLVLLLFVLFLLTLALSSLNPFQLLCVLLSNTDFPTFSFPNLIKAMTYKLGSAPSQYFQREAANPSAQSHTLSSTSTG